MNQGTSDRGVIEAGSSLEQPKTRQRHGFSKQIRSRSPQLHGNSTPIRAMAEYRASLTASLGSAENLSAQELSLIELAGREWVLLQQIDSYLLTVGSFSKKKKAAYPLLASRCQIADSLTRKLQALGLSRRAKPVSTLAERLHGQDHRPEQ